MQSLKDALVSYKAQLTYLTGGSVVGLIVWAYGMTTGKPLPTWMGFLLCIIFVVCAAYRMVRERESKIGALESLQYEQRKEFIELLGQKTRECDEAKSELVRSGPEVYLILNPPRSFILENRSASDATMVYFDPIESHNWTLTMEPIDLLGSQKKLAPSLSLFNKGTGERFVDHDLGDFFYDACDGQAPMIATLHYSTAFGAGFCRKLAFDLDKDQVKSGRWPNVTHGNVQLAV